MSGLDSLLPLVVVGLTTGAVYAIAAMGLVLTFKTSGVFNFAHGAQAAVGAYLMYSLRNVGLPWPVAALFSIALVGVVGGLLLERLARALSGKQPSARIVATIGLLVGLQGLLVAIYGAPTIVFERFLPESTVEVVGVHVRWSQIITMVLAAVAAAGLYQFFKKSRVGVAMQAVVDDPDLLGMQGINPESVRRTAWIVGSVFAAISGILLAHELNLDAAILTLLVVQAFGAAALGAFNSLPGTYLGALGIGIGAAVLPDYLGDFSDLAGQSILPFLILFVALIVTPVDKLVDRGSQVVRSVPAPPPVGAGLRRAGLVVGGGVLLGLPAIAGTDLGVYSQGLASVILFASLFLLVRTSGQVSLCHMAFAGVGAAVTAHLATAGVPWLLAVVLGGLAAVPAGVIVAIPAIRLSGVYLAIATFGYGLLVERLFFGMSLLFGGGAGAVASPRPVLFGLPTDTDTGYYYLLLVLALAAVAFVALVQRSRLGRLLRGLADQPEALEAHGANTNVTKLYAFALSAFLAGVAGAVTGPITGTASSLSFEFVRSLLLLAILAIAGRRLLVAPFVGAVLFSVVGSLIDNPSIVELLPVGFGLAAIAGAVLGGSERRASAGLRAARLQERGVLRREARAHGGRRRRPALGTGANLT